MASSGQQVIELQPQIGDDSAPVQEQKFDDNGELILFEGICWCDGIKTFLGDYYRRWGKATLCGLGVLCCVPLGNHYANIACDAWQLYLTNKSIYFHERLVYGPGCIARTVCIAITDIEAIQVESRVETVDEGCGCLGQKIAPPKTIDIEIRKGTPNAVKCCGWELSTVLRLEYCDNADEFVEAVKRQMTTMVRD